MDHIDVLIAGVDTDGLTAHLASTFGTSVSTPAARDLG
jgi:hypothetical protein